MRASFVSDYPLLFLNPFQAATVDALADVLIPPEEDSPGATDVGVTEYIDKALCGFMRELQPMYRRGLLALGEFTADRYGSAFVDLSPAEREGVVEHLDDLGREEPDNFLGQFFRILREHTVQGFFCDPAYGGNRGEAGWRLVGFPGAQWRYTTEQMQPGFDSRSIPILTIKDLYARIGVDT